ncbi:carboxylesterase family protein [Microbacterium sp. NIBRBAC000506063]|uniref:carboxylesterase family protein n=1 Tax=Microbacterium sp. NIBRBAC000506063 TaxID=2734618 RepID=UPI001CB735A1
MFAGTPWFADLEEGGLPAALRAVASALDDPETAIAESRSRVPGESPPLRLSRILAERSFGLVAERLARSHTGSGRVFRYEVVYETDAEPSPLGATHCIDVPCVFGTVRWTPLLGDRPERWNLQRDVMAAWLAFAESGEPVMPGGGGWQEAGRKGAPLCSSTPRGGRWRSAEVLLPPMTL